MATNYCFGVEIEMIAQPHKIRNDLPTLHSLYYAKIAASLKKRKLKAAADSLDDDYKKHPEHYDKWWITKDNSLKLTEEESKHFENDIPFYSLTSPRPGSVLVPMEAVSPTFYLQSPWETQIDVFWTTMAVIFHQPERSPLCGSHIHVSKGKTRFTLNELKIIAFGVVAYEAPIINMLMAERRENEYCRRNSQKSSALYRCRSMAAVATVISRARDIGALVDIMQNDRRVLWNFQNTLPRGTGTIEFRGGRFLRGKVRTKRWIAFVVSFIHWLLDQKHMSRPSMLTDYSSEDFYAAIKDSASTLSLQHLLPESYQQLNETAY